MGMNGTQKPSIVKSELAIKREHSSSMPKSSPYGNAYSSDSAKTIASNSQLSSASICVTSPAMNKYMSAFDASHPASLDDSYSRNYSQQICDPYTIATPNYDLTRSYESAAYDRYDFNSLMASQRPTMYPYLQTPIDDLSVQQQKYFHEQHHQMATDVSQTPLYPRAMYHPYDQFAAAPSSAFPSIDFKMSTAAFKATPSVPMINIATSTAYNSAHFPVQRISEYSPKSPRIGTSPNANSSPPPSSLLAPNSTTISPSYPNQSQSLSTKKSPQSEPVDFSAPPHRPLAGGSGYPFNGQTVYSRDSSPESTPSPYIDSYRSETCGEYLHWARVHRSCFDFVYSLPHTHRQ